LTVSSPPTALDLAIIPNALMAMPVSDATGWLPDKVLSCRNPVPVERILPLLI